MRKAKWLLVGLLAPELVAYVAWRQRRDAADVLSSVRVHVGQSEPVAWWRRAARWVVRLGGREEEGGGLGVEGGRERGRVGRVCRPQWGLAHGFYAVMGGFALGVDDGVAEPFLPGGTTRAALTKEGVRFLLQHEPDALPGISRADIQDKSKADGLKKLLVCAQAVWFGVNCITRLAQGLPISLLELNACAHAACALIIYAFWWEKPLDVEEATVVDIDGNAGWEGLRELCAYMWMGSRVSVRDIGMEDFHGRLRDEFDMVWLGRSPVLADLVIGEPGVNLESEMSTEKPLPLIPQAANFGVDQVRWKLDHEAYSKKDVRYRARRWWISTWLAQTLGYRRPAGIGVRKTVINHLSARDLRRWRLASRAIRRYRLEVDLYTRHSDRPELYDQDSRLDIRVPNHLSLYNGKPGELWLGFPLTGILYGGLHLLAWNAPFSTRAELVLWRLAAAAVACMPLYTVPLTASFHRAARTMTEFLSRRKAEGVYPAETSSERRRRRFREIFAVIVILGASISPLLWLLYVFGRVYLVVECFKNVAHLPEGAFQDVAWPAYLPHIE